MSPRLFFAQWAPIFVGAAALQAQNVSPPVPTHVILVQPIYAHGSHTKASEHLQTANVIFGRHRIQVKYLPPLMTEAFERFSTARDAEPFLRQFHPDIP